MAAAAPASPLNLDDLAIRREDSITKRMSRKEKRVLAKRKKTVEKFMKKQEVAKLESEKNIREKERVRAEKINRTKEIEKGLISIFRAHKINIVDEPYKSNTKKQNELMVSVLPEIQKNSSVENITLADICYALKIIVKKIKKKRDAKRRAMMKIRALNRINKLFPFWSADASPGGSTVKSPPWAMDNVEHSEPESGRVQRLIKKFRWPSNSSLVDISAKMDEESPTSVKGYLRRIRWSTSSICEETSESVWTSAAAHELGK